MQIPAEQTIRPADGRIRLVVLGLIGVAGIIAGSVALSVLVPLGEGGELIPHAAGHTLTTIAMALAAAAVGVAVWDRLRREPAGGLRRWPVILGVSLVALLVLQTISFLIGGDLAEWSGHALSVLPTLLTAPAIGAALIVACWPTDFEERQRNSSLVDAAVGAMGLAVIWIAMAYPAVPPGQTPGEVVFNVAAVVVQMSLLLIVLAMAAASHRRSALPIVQLILLQAGVLVYAGANGAAHILSRNPDESRVISLLGYVGAAAFFSLVALRPARERESAGQLWMRDLWSTVIPLSPVAIATVGLVVGLVRGDGPAPRGGVAVALILLGLVAAVIWLRTSAAAAMRRASVAAAASNLDEAVNQAWFRSLTQHSRELILVLDHRGCLVYISPAAVRLLGADSEMLLGRELPEMLPGLDDEDVRLALANSRPERPHPIDVTVPDASGVDRDLQFVVASLSGVGADGYVLTGTDVTDARRMRALLGESRRRDRLTGLLNRDAFTAAIAEAQDWASPQTLAVVVVDLSEFRVLNEARGQQVGDTVLRAVADVLDRVPGPIVSVCRLGGDDFALLLRDQEPHVSAQETVDRIREALGTLPLPDGSNIAVRAAFGYTTPTVADDSPVSLIEQANLAVGRSRSDPHLGLVRYQPSMREALLAELRLTEELRAALVNHDFVPHYQPIIDLGTGRMVAAEALIRRRLSGGGWQKPDTFIPLAERVGLVAPVDRELRKAVLADMPVLLELSPHLLVSMNLSAIEFNKELIPDIAGQLERSGVSAEHVVFEITESAAAQSEEVSRDVISGIHALGCKVALDDFGTGYSSLAGLAAMRVDVLKIDQSFVADLSSSTRAVSLLRGVVDLGRGMGLTMVAEGITTVEQADLIRGMGCERGQGFLFAQPMPLSDLVEWLRIGGRDVGPDGLAPGPGQGADRSDRPASSDLADH